MTGGLLEAIFDGGDLGALVEEISGSDDALAEVLTLTACIAMLPGERARVAEARLEAILDAVALTKAEQLEPAATETAR